MRYLLLAGSLGLALACAPPASAFPKCQSADVAELCRIAQEMFADNPSFGDP